MSAQIVKPEQIAEIVYYAQCNKIDPGHEQEFFNLLYSENVKSYNYRYQTNESETIDFDYLKWAEKKFAKTYGYPCSPVKLFALLNFYVYQACEHPGWRTSEAYHDINGLRAAATRHVPDYDEVDIYGE